MANLADAIRSFHDGSLPQNEFFAQVDRVLATEPASPSQLLAILAQEHERFGLPAGIYAELRRRILHKNESTVSPGADATRLQTQPSVSWSPPMASLSEGFKDQASAGIERMKGVGDTLNGRFVLEECIGFGGMGTVYKALDLRKLEASDRKPYIAIKVLNVQFRGHPKSLIALQREARKAQTLAHPNIVTVYDFDRDGAMVYLTMEYLSGKPLSQILRAPGFSGMPYAEVLHIVQGIAKGLAYAHERGFVHCDLKPANVFLLDSGDVKVIDFGIARVFHKTEEDVEATVFDAGSLGGLTPAYASPEMIEHLEPDPRDDIYALACITYELLTGRHPFDRVSATQARSSGMSAPRPKNLGHRQWRALKTALAFERKERTPSVMAFCQDFSGEGSKPIAVALLASGVTVAVFVAAGLSYYWASRPGKPAPVVTAQTADTPRPAVKPPAIPPATPPAMPPAKPPAVTKPTLAAVMPVLAQVPCSAMTASVNDAAVEVRGFLSQQFGLARLRKMLREIPGVQSIQLEVQQVKDDQCTLIKLFGPYWSRNHQAGQTASIRTRAANAVLTEGEPLIVDISTPGYTSYVHVDYFILDGSVAHLVPNQRARSHQAPPNHAAAIGSLGNWVISKPFGTELIMLLVAPAPLFDQVRPEVESRAEYLDAAEKQLERLVARHGADKVLVDFVQITTKARKP